MIWDASMRMMVFTMLLLSSRLLDASGDDSSKVIARLRPIGEVRIQGSQESESTSSAPQTQTKDQQSTGQATYEQHCVVCHRDGVAGAPKFRNEDDWKPRLAKQDIDSLTATAMKGLNAMPAKGTCMECSLEEMKAAIEYMVPHHE